MARSESATLARRLALPVLVATAFAGLYVEAGDIGAALFLDAEGAAGYVRAATATALWLCAAWLAKRALEYVLVVVARARQVEFPKILSDVGGVVLFAAAIMALTAVVYDRPVTGIVATGGVLVAIIGFALQAMISDVFSGIALNVERPFRIGDWIEMESGEAGEVIEINWRATRLVTINGEAITIPNGVLAGRRFINFYAPKRPFRVHKTICLDYSAPPERAAAVLTSAIQATDGVRADPAPIVLVGECTERGVEYVMHFWLDDYPKQFPVSRDVVFNALNYLNQAGLAPAYPKRDVTIYERAARAIARDMDVAELLHRVELFHPLDSSVLAQLARDVHPLELGSGATVVGEGDSGQSMFVVVAGRLEVLNKVHDGAQRRIATLEPGSVFGEMSLLTGSPRSATVVSMTPVTLLEVGKVNLERVLRTDPQLADELSRIQARRHEETGTALYFTPEDEKRASEIGVGAAIKAKILRFFEL
jgi:small-conductance mechanosensitive channel/CRP-like cAMP-binding protein